MALGTPSYVNGGVTHQEEVIKEAIYKRTTLRGIYKLQRLRRKTHYFYGRSNDE